MLVHSKWYESDYARSLCIPAIKAGAGDCSVTYEPESFIMISFRVDDYLANLRIGYNRYTCESKQYFDLTVNCIRLDANTSYSRSFSPFERIRSYDLPGNVADVVEELRKTLEPYIEKISKKLSAMAVDVDKCTELEEKAMKMLTSYYTLI